MTDCRHHYVIPTLGVAAVGVCKLCGHEKKHLNSPEEIKFNVQKRKTPAVVGKGKYMDGAR